MLAGKKFVGLSLKRFRNKENRRYYAANIAKLGWKTLTEPDNIWEKIIRNKYLNKANLLEEEKNKKSPPV